MFMRRLAVPGWQCLATQIPADCITQHRLDWLVRNDFAMQQQGTYPPILIRYGYLHYATDSHCMPGMLQP
jgi:hypothetical protein